MRKITLTSSFDGHYLYKGTTYEVDSSVGTVLLILDLFEDEILTPFEKYEVLLELIFNDPQEAVQTAGDDLEGLITGYLWDVCGLDVTDSHSHEKAVFDFEQDAALIYASLLADYGIDFYDVRFNLDISRFYMLLQGLSPETPFAQAIHYRVCEVPKRNKYNQEEVDHILAMKRHYRLRSNNKGGVDTMGQESMADLARALEREAKLYG